MDLPTSKTLRTVQGRIIQRCINSNKSIVHLGGEGEAGALLGEDSKGGAGGAVGGHQGPAALGRVGERCVVQALHAGRGLHARV
jgi:hypothetical protein